MPGRGFLPLSGCKWNSHAPVLRQNRRSKRPRETRRLIVCQTDQDLYEVLGVDKRASDKEIKAAFKKQALKVHPDVNKSPGAADQFKKVRHAYQVLSDGKARAEHDRMLRMGSAYDWDDPFSSSRSSSSRPRPPYAPKSAHGLEDVFRDLGEAFSEFAADRGTANDAVGSLWEELSSFGQEFVEFLEEEAGIDAPPDSQQRESEKPSPKPRAKQKSKETPETSKRSLEDEVEDTLKELKRRMGL